MLNLIIIFIKIFVSTFVLILFPINVIAEVKVFSSKSIPKEFVDVVQYKLFESNKTSDKNIILTLGEEAFSKAITSQDSESIIVAAYISRSAYEKALSKITDNNDRRIFGFYFDPSVEQLLILSNKIIDMQQGRFDIIYLNSWASISWHSATKTYPTRTRRLREPFKTILADDFSESILVLPADQYLINDVSISDFVATLIDRGSALIAFSPNIKNALGSIYFHPEDYAEELINYIYTDIQKSQYPDKARYKVNPHIARSIGIRLDKNFSMEGVLKDLK